MYQLLMAYELNPAYLGIHTFMNIDMNQCLTSGKYLTGMLIIYSK